VFAKLAVLFVFVPALELYLLVLIGRQIGVLPTFAMLFVTALLGVSLARAEGVRVFSAFQAALAVGKVPEEGVASGLLVLLGGALLVVPGVLTDAVGVLLLVPFTRRLCVRMLLARMQRAVEQGNLHVMQTRVGVYGAPFPFAHGPGQRRPPGAAREIIDVEGEPVQPPDNSRALTDGSDKGNDEDRTS
jgi:UPF0716 protein FxsA